MTPADKTCRPPRLLMVRHLGCQPYEPVYAAMKAFTETRCNETADEFWWLEHYPVYTLGQAGKPEHLLVPGDIPVVHADRGGQVTYHGPGQLIGYALIDIKRLGIGVRDLVSALENIMITSLSPLGILAYARADAPGVYVASRAGQHLKIGSLGVRIRRGCSYHGLALNVDMDLEPFLRINPCGYPGLEMTQVYDLITTEAKPSLQQLQAQMIDTLATILGYGEIRHQRPDHGLLLPRSDGNQRSDASSVRLS